MDKMVYHALDMVDHGIIIVDKEYKVQFWNSRIEKTSKLLKNHVLGRPLFEVCPIFMEKQYRTILHNALLNGQSRFCSGILHHAFVYPPGEDKTNSTLRQNLKVEPFDVDGDRYIMLQLTDVTNHYQSERKMKSLIKELETAYVDIKSSERMNKRLARRDPLTGLLNRLAYMEEMSRSIHVAKEDGSLIAVIFMDLDGFKEINDTYGHEGGDQLLLTVADRLRSHLRSNDIIARLGGDEFMVSILNLHQVREVAPIVRKLNGAINEPYSINGESVYISASMGISMFPSDSEIVEDLIKKADMAMYEIKHSGKNAYKFY